MADVSNGPVSRWHRLTLAVTATVTRLAARSQMIVCIAFVKSWEKPQHKVTAAISVTQCLML